MTARRMTIAAALALGLAFPAAQPSPAQESIRVGFLGPLTGVFAQAGKDMDDGLKMAFEQVNYQVAGRKIELFDEDTEGNPSTAVAKYRKLVSQDRINVLSGILLSHIGYGLVPLIERDQLPTMMFTTPDDLTKRKPPKWILRSNFSASQPMHALGDYAAKVLKYKKVAVVAMDNPFGHEQIGGFQKVFEDSGGRVIQRIWVPLNALDFAPYIAQISKDADAVCSVFLGAQSQRFLKQYMESGLKARVPLIGTGVMTDEHVLRSMGDEALGVVTVLVWSPTLDTPASKGFMKFAEAKLGRRPAYFHAVMYSTGRWIIEAARAVNGHVEDKEKFLAALRRAFETSEDPRGPMKLDEWSNPTQNIYVLKVERVGGKLQNTVVHTYPMVSQFWTYSPQEFLKLPLYSRDYPPARP
jgi:branched-chain amino acid transport system substrate-binding protein